MIPLSLKIKGFLSYRDAMKLDFTSFDLACISGSNGAGKSSILDAITWALFGQARRVDDALINSNAEDKTAEVIFDFRYEDNTYRIQRSKTRDKPTRLEFFIRTENNNNASAIHEDERFWKPLTEKSVRETEKRIRDILRLDYDTFINASFFLQGKADLFAQQRPGDRKQILSTILGLNSWETFLKRAVEERKEVESGVEKLDGQLQEINTELDEGPARKTRLAELEKELERLAERRKLRSSEVESLRRLAAALIEQRKLVDNLEGQYLAAVSKHDQALALIEARKRECQAYQDKIAEGAQIEKAYQGWQDARQLLEHWEGIAGQFRQQQAMRQAPLMEIESEHARLAQEQQSLKRSAQEVEQAKAEVVGLKDQLKTNRKVISIAEAQLARRTELEGEIRQHHQAQADARAENPRLKEEMDTLKAHIDELETSDSPTCPLCGQALSLDHRRTLIADLKRQGKLLADRFRQNQALLRDFEIHQKEMEGEFARLVSVENNLRQQNRVIDQIETRIKQTSLLTNAWNVEGGTRLVEINRQLEQNSFAMDARDRLTAIDAELKSIGYDPQAHEQARRDELQGRAAETSLRELETARAALAPLQRELADLEKQIKEQENEALQKKAAFDQARSAYEGQVKNLPNMDVAEEELKKLQEEENRCRMDVGAAHQRVQVLSQRAAQKASLSEEREENSRRIGRLKTLERAFGKDGVPALLIEQALPEIEGQANQILDRLSEGSMSVRFATQKDYKDKNREDKRETLDILISDGAGTRDYEMFSGGEAFRVNFAIRLALSRVLSQRAGAKLQTLVIDEGFGSQDALGRQRLIEAINQVRADFAKILVITHLEELKEAFPHRIEVEKTPRGSTLQMI